MYYMWSLTHNGVAEDSLTSPISKDQCSSAARQLLATRLNCGAHLQPTQCVGGAHFAVESIRLAVNAGAACSTAQCKLKWQNIIILPNPARNQRNY
jgi:hypothetical protein